MNQPPALKKALSSLQTTRNRALVEWATKRLLTYSDMLVDAGHQKETLECYWYNQPQLSLPLTRQHILEFYDSHRIALIQSYSLEDKEYSAVPHDYEGYIYPPVVSPEQPLAVSLDLSSDDTLTLDETLPHSPLQVCTLFPFQERAAAKLLRNITHKDMRGQLFRAAVGTGKTFVIGAVIRRLLDIEFTKGKTYSPWPIVYITKASIVEQTERVFRQHFNIDVNRQVKVMNIEQLRAQFGELMVVCETVVEHGEEHIRWKWRIPTQPCVLLLDECQQVKNVDSQQSQILQAYNDIKEFPTYQIHFSATPFMRVCEAQCFAVSTKLKAKYGVQEGVALSNQSWADFARFTAAPADPIEYSPAAIERLMDKLDPYITDVKGVRPQFNAHNSVQLIQFRTKEEYKFYQDAWDRYEKMRKKIEGYELSGGQSAFLILAQFTIFRKAAELCRAEYLADAMYQSVQAGQAACLAVNFKGTIRRVVTILHNKYGVSRNDISLIWGGGKTKKSKRQKQKEAVVKANDLVAELLGDMGLSLKLEDLHLADVEDYVDDDPNEVDTLRLGTQSPAERQRDIDKFQSGKSHYCCFTFKAGGVGLSLHHSDELTKEKCRRRKNNWVEPADIPNIPTRPRITFLAPTFSAIELVQGLGRAPRLTSLSDTTQVVVFYADTIEERVAALVSQKLKCLRKVVRQRESWESCITSDAAAHLPMPVADKPTEKPEDEEDNGVIDLDEDDE